MGAGRAALTRSRQPDLSKQPHAAGPRHGRAGAGGKRGRGPQPGTLGDRPTGRRGGWGRAKLGRVYLGVSPGGRPIAVKAIWAELAADRGSRTRFGGKVAAARRVRRRGPIWSRPRPEGCRAPGNPDRPRQPRPLEQAGGGRGAWRDVAPACSRTPGSRERDSVEPADGCAVADLPERYGPWKTCTSERPRRWTADGTWDRILAAAQVRDDDQLVQWGISVDSSVVRAYQHAAGARERGRRVLADRKTDGRGRDDGRGGAGPLSRRPVHQIHLAVCIQIHLAVCIKIQRHASSSLKTWACTSPPFCAPRGQVRRRWLRS